MRHTSHTVTVEALSALRIGRELVMSSCAGCGSKWLTASMSPQDPAMVFTVTHDHKVVLETTNLTDAVNAYNAIDEHAKYWGRPVE